MPRHGRAALRAQFPVVRADRLSEQRDRRARARGRRSRRRRRELAAEVTDGRVMPHFERRFALQAELRAGYARLIGAPVEEVALTTSACDGLGRLLAGLDLGPGDELITSDEEHPGLIGPLVRAARDAARRCAACRAAGGRRGRAAHRLVAVSHVSWVERRARAGGARAGRRPGDARRRAGHRGGPGRRARARLRGLRGRGQKWLCGADGTGFLWVDPAFAERVASGLAELRLLRGRQPRAGLAAEDDGRALRHAVARARGRGDVARPRSACSRRPAGRPIHERAAAPGRAAGRRAQRARAHGRTAGARPRWWRGQDADDEATRNRLAAAGVAVRNLPGRGLLRASVGAWNDEADLDRLLAALEPPGPRFMRAGSAADSPAGA